MKNNLPADWTFAAVRRRYLDLARQLGIRKPIPIDVHARSTSSERVRVKHLLWAICDGIAAGDTACIEMSVQFVTAQVHFFYAASIRAVMVKRLEQATLTANQRSRLHTTGYQVWQVHTQRRRTENEG